MNMPLSRDYGNWVMKGLIDVAYVISTNHT